LDILQIMAPPANSKLEARYKSYVGRTFLLRKVSSVPITRTTTLASTQGRVFVNREQVGDCVLILDETNSKVKVIMAVDASYCWISKYYLHKELENETFEKLDTLSEWTHEILGISEDLEEQPQRYMFQVLRLKDMARRIRQVSDEERKKING